MDTFQSLKTMRLGIVLSLLTILFGFCLGGAFGGASGELKAYLKGKAESVLDAKYGGDQKKVDKVLDKSWSYLKRAHLHAAGLGNTAIALIVLLSFFPITSTMLFLTSLSLGLGALGYSVYWMIAGLIAPGMASSDLAKESLAFLAIPSAGLCIIGVVLALFLCLKSLFRD